MKASNDLGDEVRFSGVQRKQTMTNKKNSERCKNYEERR